MSKVVVQMSMSVDGFIAGPNPAADNPLGTNGLRLHAWFYENPDKDPEDEKFAENLKNNTGAIIMGRVMYEESQPFWDGVGPFGNTPCFVLTNKGKEPQDAGKVFTFVTDGIEKALELAKKTAGNKDILINGGANTIQQYIKAGLVEEMYIHLVPILLGGGTSLFGALGEFIELEKVKVTDEKAVTHLTFRFKLEQ